MTAERYAITLRDQTSGQDRGLAEVTTGRLSTRCGERARLRFRRMRSLQTFAAVHAFTSNHFNQDRGLSSRHIFKAGRAATLDEWRRLGAV